jgi:hypothetical protein
VSDNECSCTDGSCIACWPPVDSAKLKEALATPTAPDWRDTACENIERALARAPREWWINPPDLDARNLNGGDYTTAHVAFIPRSDYVHVIEHKAFN